MTRFGPPARASMYVARNMRGVQKAKQGKCDHDYRLQETGRTKGSMRCVTCGHIMPNKGSEPT